MTEPNPFQAIKKAKPKRGQGLSTPPKPRPASTNPAVSVRQPEHAPAAQAVSQNEARRKFRVSTYITNDAGDRLEKLIHDIRQIEGKKPKIAEVLERALESLEKTLKR